MVRIFFDTSKLKLDKFVLSQGICRAGLFPVPTDVLVLSCSKSTDFTSGVKCSAFGLIFEFSNFEFFVGIFIDLTRVFGVRLTPLDLWLPFGTLASITAFKDFDIDLRCVSLTAVSILSRTIVARVFLADIPFLVILFHGYVFANN